LKSNAGPTLADLLEAPSPAAAARAAIDPSRPKLPIAEVELLAPIDHQEVWAAGVTYIRSRTARMEESVGAAVFYDKVYEAARPELFFKATPHRVAGPGQPLRIRADARWNVPEPELALVLNSRLQLVGFTIGNDMSSRDIEGENPLYLPQAKVYNQCCGLGPCIALAESMPPREKMEIRLAIRRQGQVAFEGETSAGRMARTFDDLIEYLGRDNSFPHGAFLLTGTGVVPADDFTLLPGDIVTISIAGIGELTNPVVRS
jgi:2-dehydro-3-deoxy-D-arabinonate dehydratase